MRTTAQLDDQPASAYQDETLLGAVDMAPDTHLFGSPWHVDEAPNLQPDELVLGTGCAAEGPTLSPQPVHTWDSTLCRQDDVLVGVAEQDDLEYLLDLAGAGPSPATMDLATRAPSEFAAPRRLDVAALADELQSRLSYAIDRLKDAPKTMLLEVQTPWCHPLLYRERMPRVMQGEFDLPDYSTICCRLPALDGRMHGAVGITQV